MAVSQPSLQSLLPPDNDVLAGGVESPARTTVLEAR